MREAIEVNYVPEGEDWLVTVTGRGQTLQGKAPGLIAARDRADQLVEKLAPDEEHRTVVHLLNGDALAFTSAYLSARLARPTETPATDIPATDIPATDAPAGETKKTEKPSEENPKAETPKATEPPPDSPTVPAPTPSSDQAQRASAS